jgi:thiamine biosynthesis protein ThiC
VSWRTDGELDVICVVTPWALSQPAKTDDVVISPGLAPHLHDHYRTMHRKTEEDTAVQPVNADAQWKQRAEDAVAGIISNNDRAEAERLLTKAGAWSWELVHKQVQTFIERRKHQRLMVGR